MCLNLNTCVLKETAVDIDGYMVTKNKREKHKSLIKENWHTKRNQQKQEKKIKNNGQIGNKHITLNNYFKCKWTKMLPSKDIAWQK